MAHWALARRASRAVARARRRATAGTRYRGPGRFPALSAACPAAPRAPLRPGVPLIAITQGSIHHLTLACLYSPTWTPTPAPTDMPTWTPTPAPTQTCVLSAWQSWAPCTGTGLLRVFARPIYSTQLDLLRSYMRRRRVTSLPEHRDCSSRSRRSGLC
jgi:hypothetical protein